MKVVQLVCDICGAPATHTVNLTVDRRMDPAGSMDDITNTWDLCHRHTVYALNAMSEHLSHKAAYQVSEKLRRAAEYQVKK